MLMGLVKIAFFDQSKPFSFSRCNGIAENLCPCATMVRVKTISRRSDKRCHQQRLIVEVSFKTLNGTSYGRLSSQGLK